LKNEILFKAYDEAYSKKFGSLECIDIGCSQCEKDVEFVVLLPHEEEYIESRTGKKVVTKDVHVGDSIIKIMPLPCSFMKEEKCTIHNDRPMMCRNYPYYVDPIEGDVKISLDSLCPLAEGLSKDDRRQQEFKQVWGKLATVIGEDFFLKMKMSSELWMHGRESVKTIEKFKDSKNAGISIDIHLKKSGS